MLKEIAFSPIKMDGIPSSAQADYGIPISPLKMIEIMEEDDWERFTQEWVFYLNDCYKDVYRCGGSGDMGRDVIAYIDSEKWDNYQCKHYVNNLRPSDIYIELGKLIYYTFQEEYPIPEKYYFVTSKGPGPKLISLLNNPVKLKQALYDNWVTSCESKITKKVKKVELTNELKSYIETIDFSIFEALSPIKIIQQHKKTPYHIYRFGGGIQVNRPIPKDPTSAPIEDFELNYVNALMDAYCDAEGIHINQDNLENYKKYFSNFNRARTNFYWAESLREFSRDWLPDESYLILIDDFLEAVHDIWDDEYQDGFERLKAVSNFAVNVQLESHPLKNHIKAKDKKGFCHQITNENKKTWISHD